MPVLYLLGAKLFKRKAEDVCDVFSICMIFTVMCARINCIISGCCKGKLLPGAETLRWPTREAEIIFYILLLAFLLPKVWKEKTKGRSYPIYMIAYGAFRFLIEWFRESDSASGIHIAHMWSIIALCIGLSIYIELQKKKGGKK